MEIEFDESLQPVAGLKIGYAVIRDIVVSKGNRDLERELTEVIKECRKRYNNDVAALMKGEILDDTRKMFKAFGVDPTKYRPSAEALLRRIVSGEDIYHINTVVDVNNLGSMKFELPVGVYNLDALKGNVKFKIGSEKEDIETISKRKLRMKGVIVSCDDERIFGSPVADSDKSKITPDVKNVLLLVYAPPSTTEDYITKATEFTSQKIVQYNSGSVVELGTRTVQ